MAENKGAQPNVKHFIDPVTTYAQIFIRKDTYNGTIRVELYNEEWIGQQIRTKNCPSIESALQTLLLEVMGKMDPESPKYSESFVAWAKDHPMVSVGGDGARSCMPFNAMPLIEAFKGLMPLPENKSYPIL